MLSIRYKPGPLVDLALEVAGIRGNARALNFRKHSKEWNILSQFFKNVMVDIKLPKRTVTKKIVGLVEAAGRFEFKKEQEDGSFLPTTVAVSLPITSILNIVNGHSGTLLQNVQHTLNVSRHHWH
jgi:hypothetical protein